MKFSSTKDSSFMQVFLKPIEPKTLTQEFKKSHKFKFEKESESHNKKQNLAKWIKGFE